MKSLLLVFLCFLSIESFANTTKPTDTIVTLADKSSSIILLDKGKGLIAEGKLRDALTVFKEATIKDPFNWKAFYYLSWCHLRLNNFGYAKQYSMQAIKRGGEKVDPESYEILGIAYHRLGELDSAQVNYQKAIDRFSKKQIKESGVNVHIASCVFAKEAMKKGTNQRVSIYGEINSGYNDYNPVLSKDGKVLYFTSRRGNTTGGRLNPDDQEYFEDIYRAVWNSETKEWDSISNEIERLNTNGFDALSWISKDGLKGITILNTTMTDDKVRTQSSDVCEVEFTAKGRWTNSKPIDNKSINTSFMEGYATCTADGNTMYFVSDRKGKKRYTDIYMVQKVGNSWGKAVMMNDSINTIGRETTPYITPDGRYLFFASNGHTGMGGLDIFVSENTGTGWTKAKNLGITVNTVNDDSHFVIYKEIGKAMMAGINISGQKASYDIYELDFSKLVLPIKL